MFYRSLSEIEQVHIVEAFTFELGKCYEKAIKERELEVLANVDADLCRQVADGLGLPAPQGNPPADGAISPALSQIVTEPGPVTGRKVAVIADAGSDLTGIAALTKALARQGVTALVTAATGGTLKSGRRSLVVERTFATTRSVEFDAAIIASGTSATDDIKLVVMLQELFRHCKPLGAWGDGAAMLEAAGIDRTAAGVVVGDDSDKVFSSDLVAALGLHRVWERAGAVMASAVAPSKTAPKKTASTRRVGEMTSRKETSR